MFANGRGKGNGGGKQKYSQIPSAFDDDDDSDSSGDNFSGEDFIQREIRSQQTMMRKQDEGLEMLGQGAERLSVMSLSIHEELGQQTRMLDDMEEELETATDKLSFLTLKTKALIQKSGGKRNFIIIVTLSVIAAVLMFLVVYF